MLLQGKVAVVTGSGRGVGRGIALSLAHEGAKLVINDVGCEVDGRGGAQDPAAQVVKEIQALDAGSWYSADFAKTKVPTLEEVLAADIILHVRDIHHAETEAQAFDVNHVLAELGVDDARRLQIIEVWNKADLLSEEAKAGRLAQAQRRDDVVLISSVTGEGISNLLSAIEQRLAHTSTLYDIVIDPSDGKGPAWLHQRGEVIDRVQHDDGRTTLTVRLDSDTAGQAEGKFGKSMQIRR